MSTQELTTVAVPDNSPYILKLPLDLLEASDITVDDTIAFFLDVPKKNTFKLTITKNLGSNPVTQTVRGGRYGDDVANITLPKKVVEAASLQGADLKFKSTSDGCVAVINRDSLITGGTQIVNREETTISRYADGNYILTLSEEIAAPTNFGDDVWVSIDYFGYNAMLVIDTDQSQAPEGAIPVSANSQDRAPGDGLRIHVPTRVAKVLNVSGNRITWGRTGARLIGLLG